MIYIQTYTAEVLAFIYETMTPEELYDFVMEYGEADPEGDAECSEFGAMIKSTKIFLNEYRDVLVELILRKRTEQNDYRD